jgi:hypothetical protein
MNQISVLYTSEKNILAVVASKATVQIHLTSKILQNKGTSTHGPVSSYKKKQEPSKTDVNLFSFQCVNKHSVFWGQYTRNRISDNNLATLVFFSKQISLFSNTPATTQIT